MLVQGVQAAQQPRGLALSRNQVGRFAAAAFGAVALVLFYQPWVSATVPALGEQTLSGNELARGDIRDRVDRAAFAQRGPSASTGATSAASVASSSGGLVMPTRVPTVAPGTSVGGLTMPTRVPTVAPGAAGARTSSSAASTGVDLGGLTLPTRVPTVAPGSTPQTSSFTPGGTTVGSRGPEIGRAVRAEAGPDRLPTTLLYAVPLAALGLAVFPVIWGRLGDPRDRLFGKLWTILLSFGGIAGIGYLLVKIANAPPGNDLLGPGEVVAPGWGMTGALVAFALAAVSLIIAWLSPAPPPPDRYARART